MKKRSTRFKGDILTVRKIKRSKPTIKNRFILLLLICVVSTAMTTYALADVTDYSYVTQSSTLSWHMYVFSDGYVYDPEVTSYDYIAKYNSVSSNDKNGSSPYNGGHIEFNSMTINGVEVDEDDYILRQSVHDDDDGYSWHYYVLNIAAFTQTGTFEVSIDFNAKTYKGNDLKDNKNFVWECTVKNLGTPTYTIPSYTVDYGSTLADISLPSYWSWQDSKTTVLSAGTITCYAKYNAPYYTTVTSIPITVTVNKRTVSLTWSGTSSRTYDGTASAVTATAGNLLSGDSCTVTVTGGTSSAAGTYTATASGLSNANYALPSTTTTTYTINQRTATLSWAGTTSRVYDGTASAVAATAGNLVSGDSCSVTVSNGTSSAAGTYTATASGLSNANYALPGTTTTTYTISQRTATLSWTGTTTRTYDGTASAVTATVSNLVSGDSCTVTVTGGTSAAAGTYTATATTLSNVNYALPSTTTTTYTISQRTATLSWAGTTTRAYDGTASAVTATVGNLVSGDSCTVTVTGGTSVAAGTYTASATALSNVNYTLPEDVTVSYTISQLGAILIWSGTETRTYDGTASSVTATISNLADGDSCDVTVTGGTEANAGTYEATAIGLSNSNYVLPENVSVTYIINPAQVNFSVSDTSVYYDGQPHTATVTQSSDDPVQMTEGDFSISYRDSLGVLHSSVTEVGSYGIVVYINNENFTALETELGTFTIAYAHVDIDMIFVPENFSSDTWYNTDFSISAEDGYLISKTPKSGFSSSIVISDESDIDGTTIDYYVTASSGGVVYAGTITYKLDKTAPVINAVDGIPALWQTDGATLSIDASDALSGVEAYSFDGGETWQDIETYVVSSYASFLSGTILVKDSAGNIASYDEDILVKIDQTSPEVTWDAVSEASADYLWHSSSVMSGTATDTQSGVASISVEVESDSGETSTEANGYEINTAGAFAVTLVAVDNAGNSGSSYTLTFLVDPIIGDFCDEVGTLNSTTSTLDEVIAVLDWYNALTDDQQSHILNSSEGSEAYEQLLEYWDAAQDRAVQEIQNIINAGGPTLADINYAITLYDKLDDEHKALIDLTAYADLLDKRDAKNVEALIDLIPDHPLSASCTDLEYHKATIENAVIAYEALSSSARAYVDSSKVAFMREQYSLLLALLGYTNKSGSVEVIGLVERVSATAGSTLSVQVEELSDAVVENQAIAYNITLIETASDGTTTEVEPNDGETITVKIKLASNVNTDTVQIYHILDDGTVELIGSDQNLHFVTEDGYTYAIFEASHFSIYAVAADVTIKNTHSSQTIYKVSTVAETGGSITPATATVTRGNSKTFTIKPDAGYQLADILLDGSSVKASVVEQDDGSITYTLFNVRANHTLTVSFETVSEIPRFTDIDGHWAYDSILAVVEQGWMTGISDTEFDPDGSVTRAMVVTVLWRLSDEPDSDFSTGYSDVLADQWYTDAIAWASQEGIVEGYPDGSFAPNQEISRQELALMFYRYAGTDVSQQWPELSFSDIGAVGTWALDGVSWCAECSILSGKPGNILDPEGTATRAELAVMLLRLSEYQK